MTFTLMPDNYQAPEVKLEIKLQAYPHPPTNKTPVLTGYVKITKAHLAALNRVVEAGEGGNLAFLRVALWDSEGGAEGVIEYKEYKISSEPTIESKWY